MSNDWEKKFQIWSGPSSDTEAQKCANAENAIRSAVKSSTALGNRQINVFAHGSYRNNTNVRQNSDVDICVCCFDSFLYDFSSAQGFTREDVGFENATYFYDQFKSEVHQALVSQFGSSGVTLGNKAFDVHANSYRVDADVVAAFEHRRYTRFDSYSRLYKYESGIEFRSSSGEQFINWPQHHYDNGVTKNNSTSRYFKFVTRIIKRLRYEMSDAGIPVANGISSYLIECMVYNVPNEGFRQTDYTGDVRYVLAHIYHAIKSAASCEEWVEVNGMKWLFRGQDLKRQAAFAWVSAAWDYVGFD